jgi:hypothetical protein
MRDAGKTDLQGTALLAVTAEARAVDPFTGKEAIVQPVGTPLKPGNRYYGGHDKGHTYCLHCTSKVSLVEDKPGVSGSSGKGTPSYFKPVRKHDDDCIVPLRPVENRKAPVDRTKGYQINLNTAQFSDVFNQRSGVYSVRRDGSIEKLLDEDMRDRETFVVREVQDLVKFIGKADFGRIRDSRVVFQNNAVDWDEFFIRAGTPSRLKNLVERLEAHKKGTEPLFATLEVTTTAYHNPQPGRGGKVPRAPIDSIEIGRDARGMRAFARIDVYVDERNNSYVRDALLKPDTYLVMGEVRHKMLEHNNSTTHYLNITVTDSRQVMPVNIANIYAARMQASNGSSKSTAPPEPNGP